MGEDDYMFFELWISTLIILGVVGLVRTFHSLQAFNWLLKEQKRLEKIRIKSKNLPEFILLLPAFMEQSIVGDSLSYFNKFYYPKDKLTLMVITSDNSEKKLRRIRRNELNNFCKIIWGTKKKSIEVNNGLFPRYLLPKIDSYLHKVKTLDDFSKHVLKLYESYPTTRKLANSWIKANRKNSCQIVCIDDPNDESNKSKKENYAIVYLKECAPHLIKSNPFIGVYDFDTKPDLRTLQGIAKVSLRSGRVYIIQQPAVPLNNLNASSNLVENLLLKAYYIMHIRRSFGVELYMHSIDSKNKFAMLKYCISQGLYARYDDFVELGDFTEPIDDIPLGYRVSLLNFGTGAIPYVSVVDAAPRLSSLSNQLFNIFWAISVGLLDEFSFLKKQGRKIISMPMVVIRSLLTFLLQYGVFPIMLIWILSSVYFLIVNLYYFLVNLLVLYVSYGVSSLFVSYSISKLSNSKMIVPRQSKEGVSSYWTLFLISPLRGILKFLFVGRSILITISKFISKKRLVSPIKTER